MFSDVAKDAPTTSFAVRCLGSLPLKDKVTSLVGLQEPLRQLYLSGAGHGVSKSYIFSHVNEYVRKQYHIITNIWIIPKLKITLHLFN